jgi:dienelactone hydrolase
MHTISLQRILCASFSLIVMSEPFAFSFQQAPETLTGTARLELEGDIAASMVDGIDRFLLRQIDQSVGQRESFWKRDFSSSDAYSRSLEANRKQLAHILGVRDTRVVFEAPDLMSTLQNDAVVGKHEKFDILAIRWPVVRDVHSEGLLLIPHTPGIKGTLIYIPDADQTPQQVCTEQQILGTQSPIRAAAEGYRVVIPRLISRRMVQRNGRSTISQREYLYRSSFELGRQLLGYEIQKVLACVDWLSREESKRDESATEHPIRVEGYGEGGLIALLSGAIDTRIDSVGVYGAFGSRRNGWQECIDRNIFGLLRQFGDAELAAMIAPRPLVIDNSNYPRVVLSGQGGGAPAILDRSLVDPAEVERARRLTARLPVHSPWLTEVSQPRASGFPAIAPPTWVRKMDPLEQEDRLVHEIDRDTQWLLRESPYVRASFMSQIDTKSLESYEKSIEDYRRIFREEVIGHFDIPLKPFHARSRKIYDTERLTGYEVVLDVWEDVIAYGILLLPKDLQPGEKRPVVVCQHGLEGRPTDVIVNDHPAYHDFAAKLCERGFITFAPQNIYIGKDRFRTLQRKANPLGKSLFSIMVPQHQQIVNWLKELPNVDGKKIAFYGLSYGGKSAMRIPPLVTDYCLSICSADFNEWVAKNASTRLPFSYIWTMEYEIFEWDLGSTFNYAEMAALIAPRPFMVERGHTDGVSTDEWVSFEYAKVFHLYSHRLKLPERCEMEIFDGPHTIHGRGTFDFLHKHLSWPQR